MDLARAIHRARVFYSLKALVCVITFAISTVFYSFLTTVAKTKCLSKTGDCIVKHPHTHATGLAMVVRKLLTVQY